MPRPWPGKFRDALRGIWAAMRTERSFAVHLPMAAMVIVAAAALRVSLVEWCLLLLCIALVLAAEIFNTAIERLAHEVDRQQNEAIGAALDMASGAVLTTAMGAAAVGSIIFLYRLGTFLGLWAG